MSRIAAAFFLTCASVCAAPPRDFSSMADRFFDELYFRYNPTIGTQAGLHQYDSMLEDYSAASVAERTAAYRKFRRELETIAPAALTESDRADRELILGNIDATLLELEQIRMWRRNPDVYSSGITSSAFTIMSRRFAAEDDRLRSLVARERQMPAALDAARKNLENPPRIYTEIALEQLPGIKSFFEKDVPAAFTHVPAGALRSEFDRTNRAVLDALAAYEAWLRNDLLPRSRGDFRIGAGNYRRKLQYEEMVDTPLDHLLAIGMEDLRRNQKALAETAHKIDPKLPAREALAGLERDHPAAGALLDAFRGVLAGLREFIESARIVTIPSTVPPILEETPPFMRALTFASMDTPGPFEKVAKEAFFNVTLPERDWDPKRVEEHLEGFNRGVIISTAIHEAYPGHYVQFLWLQQAASKTRKLLGCGSNAEGWAHYTEQMMFDEGYGGGDLKLRLGQLQDALLRNARYIVGIRMHTGTMTFDEAVDFFVNEGYQTRANALRETKRGTSDPTYLVYTLGKLEILKLRADYRRKTGASLREFHDAFLKLGFPPVRIVRRALMGDDSPAL